MADGRAPRPTPAEEVKRYEVRWASLDPVEGAEMAKARPVVIVSLDALNEHLRTVTICPLTSSLHPGWRTRVPVRIAQRDAEIAVDHIRSVSKARVGRRLGVLSDADARALRMRITEMYGE